MMSKLIMSFMVGLSAVMPPVMAVESDAKAPAPAGAFNLRIVSDSVPDWSSRSNFVRSALSGWQTDQEKAIAQFRWMHRSRRVGTCVYEDQRPVLDPVLFFNSYGITFCAMISEMNCSLWEAGGLKGRVVDLPAHVVAEVAYNGAWHMFDNDFANYFINEKGEVAGAGELGGSRVHGNVADLKPGEYYIFDHCPPASAPRGHIFQGPNSWWLIDVARDWYPGPQQVQPRTHVTGAHGGHRYILGVRAGESYTRYWRPLGTGSAFARPVNGEDPAVKTPLRNNRGNGEWIWTPDLSNAGVFFAAGNTQWTGSGVGAVEKDKPASVTLRVMAANVVTSARIEAAVTGSPRFSVSGNNGLSWQSVDAVADGRGGIACNVDSAIAGRLEYLIKVELNGGAALKGITIRTITQVNPRALPGLKLGRNAIAAVSDEHLEYITMNPRLAGGRFSQEVSAGTGWQSVEQPREWDSSIRALGKAWLDLKVVAPGDIRKVRMACTANMFEPSAFLELSVNAGQGWSRLGLFEPQGAPYDRRISVETNGFVSGARSVQMRYAFDEGGSGLVNAFVEVGYQPAGGFMPYDITYCWDEYRGGKWVERRHVEKIAAPDYRYEVNVGGERPPRMNWMRIEPSGRAQAGYADGEDVGLKYAREPYRLVYGDNISTGCTYEVSRAPAVAYPDKGGCLPGTARDRLLTDGFIGESSVWKLDKISLSGPKNEKRVGELVCWEPGGAVVVTVDLGGVKTAGGARVAALQPNAGILFPSKMTVETSVDGKVFSKAGEASWEDCFFPPGDQLQWEGADSPAYEALPAGGIISYRFPVLFAKQVEAGYVRFTLEPPSDSKAGIGLYELEVWDRIEKQPWSERLVLP